MKLQLILTGETKILKEVLYAILMHKYFDSDEIAEFIFEVDIA